MATLYLLALLFLSDWLRFTDEITLGTQFDLTCLPNVIKMCLLSKANVHLPCITSYFQNQRMWPLLRIKEIQS